MMMMMMVTTSLNFQSIVKQQAKEIEEVTQTKLIKGYHIRLHHPHYHLVLIIHHTLINLVIDLVEAVVVVEVVIEEVGMKK